MNALARMEKGGFVNLDTLNPTGRIQLAFAYDALSESTKTAYQKAWKRLVTRGMSIEDLTDESLALVISQLDKDSLSPATISLTVAAVKWYFKHIVRSSQKWTTTDKRLITIKRNSENEGNGQVDGLDWSDVDVVCRLSVLDGTAKGLRDSALIRLMSDCLLRVSEAVAVNVEDIKDKTLLVRSSKTDQEGIGETLYVTSDTRRIISKYRKKAGIESGALFRQVRRGDHIQTGRLSARSARRQITYWAEMAGVEGFISGHSLRVGSAVSLAQAGASVVDMQVAGRWKSSQMPAHYAKAQLAERGAIARYKEKKRP